MSISKGKLLILAILLVGLFVSFNWKTTPKASAASIYGGCIDKDAKDVFDIQQLFTKSITTFNGGQKEDYCYTFPTTGKTYLMEGVCSNGNFQTYQKNCNELNINNSTNYQCMNGACQDLYNSVVELKAGETLTSSQGAKLTVDKVVSQVNGNSMALVSIQRPYKGTLVSEGSKINIGYGAKYLKEFGFHIYYLDVNSSTNKVKLQIYPNCTAAYNACLKNDDLKNNLVMNSCDSVCDDEKLPSEVSGSKGKFTGFYKNDTKLYQDLGQYLNNSYDFCYNQVQSYLGFDAPFSNFYIKSIYSPFSGAQAAGNVITAGVKNVDNDYLKSFIVDGDVKMKKGICPSDFAQSHELTHVFLHGTVISPNTFQGVENNASRWLNEGLASYVSVNGLDPNNILKINCSATGWSVNGTVEKPYDNLASNDWNYINNNTLNFYYTGACFWDYINKNFGNNKFKSILTKVDSLRYKPGKYYIFKDIVTPVLGVDISSIAKQQFGINADLNITIE